MPVQPNHRGAAGDGTAGWTHVFCGFPLISALELHPAGMAKETSSQWVVAGGADVDGAAPVPGAPAFVRGTVGTVAPVGAEVARVVAGLVAVVVELVDTTLGGEHPDNTTPMRPQASAVAGPATRSRFNRDLSPTEGTH